MSSSLDRRRESLRQDALLISGSVAGVLCFAICQLTHWSVLAVFALALPVAWAAHQALYLLLVRRAQRLSRSSRG